MAVKINLNSAQDNEADVLEEQPSASPSAAPVVRRQTHEDLTNESHAVSFEKIKEDAKRLGRQDGDGKRAFVAFARRLVEGGSEGVLVNSRATEDLVEGKSHAAYLYDSFMSASSKASDNVVGADNKESYTAQVSKVKALIRLGNMYPETAIPIFERAKSVHKALATDPKTADRLKYKSTYTALITVAINQCKQTKGPDGKPVKLHPFEDKDIRDLLLNPEDEKVVTSAMLIMQAVKMIEGAMVDRPATDGRPARTAAVDNNNRFPAIIQALREIASDTDARDGTSTVNDFDLDKKAKADKKAAAEANKAAKAAAEKSKKAKTEAEKAKNASKAISDELDDDDMSELDDEAEASMTQAEAAELDELNINVSP